MVEDDPNLKASGYRIQRIVHDLAHEHMEGQVATAHQALYMTMGQDRMIEVNHRSDWWDLRNHLLQKLVDENTAGPGDGSTSVTPAARRPNEGREHSKQSDYESFKRGDGISVKTSPNGTVRYGWIVGLGDPVPHKEQPLNDTDSRRFTIEYRDTGKTAVVDARSIKSWPTDEIPLFRKLELEALNAEKELLRTTERYTVSGPLVAPASRQIQEIATPTETTAQLEEVTETEQPEVEHREPAQEQTAPARVQKAPATGTGLMDKKNYSNCNKDNVIGDITAGRSTRNRPTALTAQEELKNLNPVTILGQGLLELFSMTNAVEKILAMGRHNKEPHHEEEDNQISLAGPHTVELEQRENEQTKLRQPPDEAKR
jgi:hypothetical protein